MHLRQVFATNLMGCLSSWFLTTCLYLYLKKLLVSESFTGSSIYVCHHISPFVRWFGGEACIQTLKVDMRKSEKDGLWPVISAPLSQFLRFLLPLNKEAVPPSVLIWGWLWHSFELTFPKQSFCNQSRQKQQHDHHSRPPFVQDWQPVLVCNFHRKPHWVPANIVKAVGPVSFQTDTGLVLPVVPWNVQPDTVIPNPNHTVQTDSKKPVQARDKTLNQHHFP